MAIDAEDAAFVSEFVECYVQSFFAPAAAAHLSFLFTIAVPSLLRILKRFNSHGAQAYTNNRAFGIMTSAPLECEPICITTNTKVSGEFESMKNGFGLAVLPLALIVLTGNPGALNRASESVSKGELLEPAAASAGSLYSKHCASCHGRDGRSKTLKAKFNHARDLTDSAWQGNVTDERIFNSIMNGKGKKMPGYRRKLSEAEIDSLVAYVRGLKQ